MTADQTDPNLPSEISSLSESIRQQSFTHRSLRAQSVARHQTNERLEFLGDAVLELVVSEFLIKQYPKHDEGTLTRYRAAIVRTESLAAVARELDLGAHLQLSEHEPYQPEQLSDSLLADTFEAVVGAIYTDQGRAAAEAFIFKYLLHDVSLFITSSHAKDPKTLLQEKVQALGKPTPIYTIVTSKGPDHDKIFTAAVRIKGEQEYQGDGNSKQRAEQAAAAAALKSVFSLEENLV